MRKAPMHIKLLTFQVCLCFRVCEGQVKCMRVCKFFGISSRKSISNATSCYVTQLEKTRRIAERVKAEWKMYKKYMDQKRAHEDFKIFKETGKRPVGALTGTKCNPPPKIEKPKQHVLIFGDCHCWNMYTIARVCMLNHLSVKRRHVPVIICLLIRKSASRNSILIRIKSILILKI